MLFVVVRVFDARMSCPAKLATYAPSRLPNVGEVGRHTLTVLNSACNSKVPVQSSGRVGRPGPHVAPRSPEKGLPQQFPVVWLILGTWHLRVVPAVEPQPGGLLCGNPCFQRKGSRARHCCRFFSFVSSSSVLRHGPRTCPTLPARRRQRSRKRKPPKAIGPGR